MPTQSSANSEKTSVEEGELVIRRTYDARLDLVWKVWSDPEHAKHWWGPKGFTAPVVELDARPGGKWRSLMIAPDGTEYWQHGVYQEVIPKKKVSFTFIWDEEPDHEMRVTFSFAARGNKTEITFRQTGFKSADERDGHQGGWNESFDRLAEYLKKLKEA
jgi:uncharacterized protein YndB with AHSA1/START domain